MPRARPYRCPGARADLPGGPRLLSEQDAALLEAEADARAPEQAHGDGQGQAQLEAHLEER